MDGLHKVEGPLCIPLQGGPYILLIVGPPRLALGYWLRLRIWKRQSMSALGQKQTFALQQVMSALPPKADMCGHYLMSAKCQ